MKDFLERALRISKDLKAYSNNFEYCALYDKAEYVIKQGNWLIELMETTLPELKEMISYLESKKIK